MYQVLQTRLFMLSSWQQNINGAAHYKCGAFRVVWNLTTKPSALSMGWLKDHIKYSKPRLIRIRFVRRFYPV